MYICSSMFIILQEKGIHGPEILQILLLSFLYRYSTRFEDIAAAYELARSLYAFYETQNDPVALMKCDMVILSVYFFLNVKC